MRMFLDARVWSRRVARALGEAIQPARAADEDKDLEGSGDEDLLALAALEIRVLVTFDAKDFVPILREWAEGGRHHTPGARSRWRCRAWGGDALGLATRAPPRLARE